MSPWLVGFAAICGCGVLLILAVRALYRFLIRKALL